MTISDTSPHTPLSLAVPGRNLSLLRNLRLSLKIALRELRSGLQGFYIFLSCLTLGVAAIAAIGSFSSAIEQGLNDQGRSLLGGDIELRLVHRQLSPEKFERLNGQGTVVELATLRAMVSSGDGARRTLVELKAVDGGYPLFGTLKLSKKAQLTALLAKQKTRWGIVVDPALAERLGAKLGDTLKLGQSEFELRALIKQEPDRVSGGFFFGPRVIISKPALQSTGLVKPGSLIYWHYKIKLGEAVSPEQLAAFEERLETEFPDEGWRVRNRTNAAPGTKRFIDRLVLFLSLVGLTALIVGGLGIGNAVKNFLEARLRNIAMLKCVGAPSSSIFQIYLIQVMLLASLGIGIGLVLGVGLPILLGAALEGVLPLKLSTGIHPFPVLAAAAFGYLITLAFAILPLANAKTLPATALFRSNIQASSKRPEAGVLAILAATTLAIAGLAISGLACLLIAGLLVFARVMGGS